MKIVVTGASGHLGKYVVHRFAEAGHEVVAAAHTGRCEAPYGFHRVGNVREIALDLTAEASVEVLADALAASGEAAPGALVHLAAWHPPATAATTTTDRTRLLEANVLGTMRAYEAARRAKATAVVYASTFEVYGEPRENPITETSRVHPLTDYGASKLAGEDHLFSLQAEDGIRGVSLRMPAIYGVGEHTARALPNFLRAVRQGDVPTIHGDGEDQRDLLHVRDAAQAIDRALHSGASGVFNVSDGEAHTIAALAQAALTAAGMTATPKQLPREKPRRDYHMSIEKARRELGFAPSVKLLDGMIEQLAWLRAVP
jgi:nucleoside-diphosphate-sugar epimerase